MAEEAHKEPTMEEILASIRKIISEDDDSRPAPAQAKFRTVEPEAEMSGPEGEPANLTIGDEDNMFEEFDLSDLTEEVAGEAVKDTVETFTDLDVDAPEGDEFEELELPEEIEEATDEEDSFELPEIEVETTIETEPEFDEEPEVAFEPEVDFESEPEVEFEMETEEVAAAPAPAPEPEPVSRAEVKMQGLTEASTEAAAAGALARLVSKMDMGSEHTLEGLVREMLKPMIKEWLDANLPAIVEDKVEAEVQRIARLAR